MMVASESWRSSVDLPPMFGPVSTSVAEVASPARARAPLSAAAPAAGGPLVSHERSTRENNVTLATAVHILDANQLLLWMNTQ